MRREKAEHLHPPGQGRLEKFLLGMEKENFIERLAGTVGGLGVKAGGLATGQGFSVGPSFRADDIAGGKVVVDASAVASVAQAYLFQFRVRIPELANEKLDLEFLAAQRNFPRMEYYGPGPDSEKGGRSVYRLEGPSFDATAGIRTVKRLKLGLTGGYLNWNVGPGVRPGVISSDQVFVPLTTPGIDSQTAFWRGGGFAEFDYRDIPDGNSRSGGYYTAKYLYYDDQGLNQHTFRRLDLEAQQYLPLFNGKRVIAFRARTAMTWSGKDQTVPFYMQPSVGGSDDLRGFRPYRFSDDNHAVANVEYRWESFTGLDMALFFDAGKVVPRRTQINFHDLETSAGFGFRFNARNVTFLRLDFGFSHEGFQVWFKFSNPF